MGKWTTFKVLLFIILEIKAEKIPPFDKIFSASSSNCFLRVQRENLNKKLHFWQKLSLFLTPCWTMNKKISAYYCLFSSKLFRSAVDEAGDRSRSFSREKCLSNKSWLSAKCLSRLTKFFLKSWKIEFYVSDRIFWAFFERKNEAFLSFPCIEQKFFASSPIVFGSVVKPAFYVRGGSIRERT